MIYSCFCNNALTTGKHVLLCYQLRIDESVITLAHLEHLLKRCINTHAMLKHPSLEVRSMYSSKNGKKPFRILIKLFKFNQIMASAIWDKVIVSRVLVICKLHLIHILERLLLTRRVNFKESWNVASLIFRWKNLIRHWTTSQNWRILLRHKAQ